MTQIQIDESLTAQLENTENRVALCDSAGRIVGYFLKSLPEEAGIGAPEQRAGAVSKPSIGGNAKALTSCSGTTEDVTAQLRPGVSPPLVKDPVERARLISEMLDRMLANPLPPNAPRFTRDELHDRR